MGVTQSIRRSVMLGMIRQYYLNQSANFKPQRLVALDDVVFKPWIIDGKVNPKKYLACGMICFEEERPKKQVFTALKAADRNYNLVEYEIWCHPNTLNEAKTVVRKLSSNIRNKTTIHSLDEILRGRQPNNLLIYASEAIAPETKDSDIYWEIKECVSKYGFSLAAVCGRVKARIERVLQSIADEGYFVEEFLVTETYVVYQIQKTVKTEQVKCDLKLADITNLSEEQWRELDSKMLNNSIIVDGTDATDEDSQILFSRIHYLLNRIPNETSKTDILSQVSPPKIDGRKSIALGLEYQRKVTDACKKKGWIIIGSFKRGKPDILRFDEQRRVIMVIAVKSYSLEVIIKGKSYHNCKGHKYVVSFMASRDAKAEVKAARENGLDRIWLICGNLKTGNTIYSGYVGFDEKVGLKEKQQD